MGKKRIFVSFVLASLLLASFVIADGTNSTTNPTVKNWTGVCSKINEIVSDKIKGFDDGKVRRINSYNNTENMIQRLITQLASKGANVTLAQSDFQVLQGNVNQFDTDYSTFIVKLDSLKNFTCGNSSGDFASGLKDAKTFLPVLRSDSIQVREQVMKIKIDLMQIRGNLVEVKLGQKINSTQEDIQRRVNNMGNRTAQMEGRIQNRLNRFANRTK